MLWPVNYDLGRSLLSGSWDVGYQTLDVSSWPGLEGSSFLSLPNRDHGRRSMSAIGQLS